MKKLLHITIYTLLCISLLNAQVIEPFKIRYNTIVKGNIEIIGNTLMTSPSKEFLGGEPKSILNNDTVEMKYIDADNNQNSKNSSSATLALTQNSEILQARLYWGARTQDRDWLKRAKLTLSNASNSMDVTADRVNATKVKTYYTATADVTQFVKTQGNSEYWVSDIFADEGKDMFAGWSLVVVYKNESMPLRSLTVFDGYAKVPEKVEIKVDGFESPLNASFNSYLGVVAFEGDRKSRDFFKLNGEALFDELSSKENFFNSKITKFAKPVKNRKPNYSNTLGLDIKMLDISGKIKSGDNSALFSFDTNNEDWYQPIVLTFANDYNTELNVTQSLDVNTTIIVAENNETQAEIIIKEEPQAVQIEETPEVETAFKSKPSYDIKVGALVNSVLASAATKWSTGELTEGVDTEVTTGYGVRLIYEREIFRVALEVELTNWVKADYIEYKLFSDYIYKINNDVGVFTGLGVGYLIFSDDYTQTSTSTIAPEFRLGVLLKPSIFNITSLENLELEIGYQFKYINAENTENILDNKHTITLENASILSIGFNWSF